jgi:hypothetical protein
VKAMIYLIWDDHENPMGCRCCRYSGPEYLHGIFGSKEDAEKELETLARQDDVEPEDRFTPIWMNDKAVLILGRSEEEFEHTFFVHAYELDIIKEE